MAAFCSAVLGWSARSEAEGWRPATVFTVRGYRLGGLSDLTAPVYPAGTPAHIAYYLAVAALDERVAAAAAAGAGIVVAPFDAGDDGRIATIVDPFGCPVSLWQRVPGRGWTYPPGTPGTPGILRHVSASPAAAAEFYARVLATCDPLVEFVGGPPGGSEPHWSLVLADSATAVHERAAAYGPGVGRLRSGPAGAVAELTAPEGLTLFAG